MSFAAGVLVYSVFLRGKKWHSVNSSLIIKVLMSIKSISKHFGIPKITGFNDSGGGEKTFFIVIVHSLEFNSTIGT